MTKIKNTKKGMAKKTLSMSLVVAMLATSNVPVWAAEFSDGTDASVATEADAFAAEAPVVDDTEDAAPASVMVNEADITLNLSADSKKVVWGGASVISGTVTKTDGSEVEGGWQYRWVDEKGIAYASSNGKVDDAAYEWKNCQYYDGYNVFHFTHDRYLSLFSTVFYNSYLFTRISYHAFQTLSNSKKKQPDIGFPYIQLPLLSSIC